MGECLMVCCVAVMALWGLLLGGVRVLTGPLGLREAREAVPGFAPPGHDAGPGARVVVELEVTPC